MTLKHYVEFYYAGVFMSETEVRSVERRDLSNVKAPKNCFGFRFFDREETEVDGEMLKGKMKNYSGYYYFGTVYTKEDVEKYVDNNKILLSNMSGNGYDRVVKTRLGNFQPFYKEDVIMLEN